MTDLQTLLAAAERLTDQNEKMGAVRYAAGSQLAEAMLDLLRPLLPGRPVPIEWDFDEDAVRWTVIADEVCECRATTDVNGNPATYSTANGRLPRGSARFGKWPLFRTRAEADREAYWRRLEAVIRQAGELAQGDGR